MKPFCDNKTADLILDFIENKASNKEVSKIKLTLTKYLEVAVEDGGFDDDFILGFTKALFSVNPRNSLQYFFDQSCYDGFGLINKKLHVLFITKVESFFGWCINLNLPFYKTYTDAVKATGVRPSAFAVKNRINFDVIFNVYDEWYLSNGETGAEHYARQISASKDFVKLCDFFDISPTKFKDPLDWWSDRSPEPGFEYDFKNAVLECSKEECRYFARWFSKKPKNWFVDNEHWLKRF